MTPQARVQAAIEILDRILEGQPAEQALTGWARRARYAGSGDRAAIRDHVFDALRRKRSLAARGGADTGRGLMLGAVRDAGQDPDQVFTGARHAPPALAGDERGAGRRPSEGAEALDLPDWLWPEFSRSLGADAARAGAALQGRAPVFLRVNSGRTDRATVMAALAEEGIETAPHQTVPTALRVLSGARRIARSTPYETGQVELQDASSQAVTLSIPIEPGMRVLDYCAGGGGKSLALAARGARVWAHDADPGRMADLPQRARHAGVDIGVLADGVPPGAEPFDVVLIDVPCSGSGAWRRSPAGKWSLTAEQLAGLQRIQAGLLRDTSRLVAGNGCLAYATCSVLRGENSEQIETFMADSSGWKMQFTRQWPVDEDGDGFFAAHLTRKQIANNHR
ncbi:16S rRNA (cytosine967-C5)-methyltransferase [Cribrihabitans marinus]|uniref:16S rRNA (Cytosine967-C5)-methyltransferase n=1 Tax=Cribrihabitans marinus TaxID=1227549 RepID=A0A1H6WIC4_9RHOB|nr:RsmB/NOP family class I SAM-dependent RNA methyltransferase [Cribrihabitans marinus]GGH24335.1 SAM-dependent methyltransferase [Cribrihabitans marinus]SEJ13847.1 16S rRNA (cytosine967-C5)-methyltransferase [Cribrihabitans marinus]